MIDKNKKLNEDSLVTINGGKEDPDGFILKKVAYIDSSNCICCGSCKIVCPYDAIEVSNNKYIVNDNCRGNRCMACDYHCPTDAISFKPC